MTQAEGASSVKEHVLQANSSLFSALSSRGNSKFELRESALALAREACTRYLPLRAEAEKDLLVGVLGGLVAPVFCGGGRHGGVVGFCGRV